MSKYGVGPAQEAQLTSLMERVGVRESDLIERFIKGSGPGGQKINKTSSCVYLQHIPSGLEIKCQRARSQALNRFFARRELCLRLEERILGAASKKRQAIEKIKRQTRKRSKRAKEKMLGDKKMRSEKKTRRGRVRE